MMPKVKAPDKPKMPQSALDQKMIRPPDETAKAFSSMVSTSPMGLTRRAETKKKTLLGGA